MVDEIKTLKQGLKDALSGQVVGLTRVYTYPPPSPAEYPYLYMEVVDIAPIALGGSSFEVALDLTVVLASGLTEQAVDQLDTMMMPLGAGSIEAALQADRTLGDSATSISLLNIERAGFMDLPYDPVAQHYGAVWRVRADIQVLT